MNGAKGRPITAIFHLLLAPADSCQGSYRVVDGASAVYPGLHTLDLFQLHVPAGSGKGNSSHGALEIQHLIPSRTLVVCLANDTGHRDGNSNLLDKQRQSTHVLSIGQG